MNLRIWRDLTPEEEKYFREWARNNYKRFEDINGTWHYIVQEECVKINKGE